MKRARRGGAVGPQDLLEEVVVGPAPECPLFNIIKRYNVSMRTLGLRVLKEGGSIQEFFEVCVKPHLLDAIIRELHQSPGLSQVEIVRYRNGRLYGLVKVESSPICKVFLESECVLTSVQSADGMVEWAVMGTNSALKDLKDEIGKSGYRIKVKKVSSIKEEKLLAARQKMILEMALRRGYFDSPRKIDLHELAGELGVEPGTALEALQRAQKKVLVGHLRSIRHSA